MSGVDTNGRAYARLSQLQIGDQVQVDAGFRCIPSGKTLQVAADPSGNLFIQCTAGMHFLDGQMDVDHDTLVGVYPA